MNRTMLKKNGTDFYSTDNLFINSFVSFQGKIYIHAKIFVSYNSLKREIHLTACIFYGKNSKEVISHEN